MKQKPSSLSPNLNQVQEELSQKNDFGNTLIFGLFTNISVG
jgi:hypothetical protein